MKSEPIPEDIASEVFTLASRYYAETTEGYSVSELVEAGKEVQIPPELIQQAIDEVQAKHKRKRQQRRRLVQVGAGILAALALWSGWTYNSLSHAQSNVELAWAQVENQLQRRADLIPNLVSITQASAQQQELVTLLIQSRQAYLQADSQTEQLQALKAINDAIARFWEYAATDSQLQSTQLYTNLQYELAGTENRIAVERMRYNQAVNAYNQKIEQFPNVLVAQVFGFDKMPLFQANAG